MDALGRCYLAFLGREAVILGDRLYALRLLGQSHALPWGLDLGALDSCFTLPGSLEPNTELKHAMQFIGMT